MKFFNKKFYLPLNIFLCLIILFCSSCAIDISVIDKSNSDGNNQASNHRIGTNVSFDNNSTVNNNYKPAKNWGASEVYTYGLRGIGADVMPIVAFGGPYEPSGTSYNGHVQPNFNEDKYWQLLKDAGVNNICFTWNEYRAETDSVMRALNQAQKFGMTYLDRTSVV